jgi:dTDP-glucose pyrophosphorylase
MNLKPINVTKTYLPDRKKLDKYIDQIYESTWLNKWIYEEQLIKAVDFYQNSSYGDYLHNLLR